MTRCLSCEQIERLLDGQLSPAEQAAAEAHLERCPTCQEALARLWESLPGEPGEFRTRGIRPTPHVPASFLAALKANPPADDAAAPVPFSLPEIPGFEILAELGRGGMGVVYRAQQHRPNRLVALKQMLGSQASADDRLRFQREAEAMARLTHPNIVPVYQVGEHNGQPFFIMELLEGGSLAQKVASTTQTASDAAELVETLARAIHHAHEHGILHRDLKPANILLSAQHTPKITDFGLAKQLTGQESLTPSEAMLGTPGYMAPEQAPGSGATVGPPADIYALGAILYRLLTGRPPFLGANVVETILQTIDDEPVPPRRLNPKVPRDLETICLKCLEKQPGKRYASALDLADDLSRFRRGESIHARPPSLGERSWKWARRRPAVAALWGVCLVFLVCLFVAIWHDRRRTVQHVTELSEQIEQTERARKSADQNAAEAETRKKEAEDAREAAIRAGKESQRRSLRLTLASARQRMEEGDLSLGLLHAAAGLALEQDEAGRRTSRIRLATGLRQMSRLLQIWTHERGVTHLTFSPDGRHLLTTSADHTARLWDTTGHSQPITLKHDGPVHFGAFSPDGRKIATAGDDRTVRLWDARTGKALREPFQLTEPALQVAFAPGAGKHLLAVSGNRYVGTIWRQGRETRIVQPGRWEPGLPILRPRRILVGIGPNGVPKYTTIMETIPGPLRYVPGTTTGIPGLMQRVDPHGAVHFWEVETGNALTAPLKQNGWINSAAFHPQGGRVVTATGNLQGNQVAQIWDVMTNREGPRLPHRDDVHWAMFSPDGRRVLTASGPILGSHGEARLWDAATGQAVGRPMVHVGPVTHAMFNPEGTLVLTASDDHTARIWDAGSGEPVTLPMRHGDRVVGAWYDPTGRLVLTASWDGTARLWHAHSGDPFGAVLRHAGRLTWAAFSPDGRMVATADREGVIRLWDLATDTLAQPILRHAGPVPPTTERRMDFLVDKRMVRSRVYLSKQVATSATFSHDGRFVLTGTGDLVSPRTTTGKGEAGPLEVETRNSHLWDVTKGKAIVPALSHGAAVTASTIRPDGRCILTVNHDGVRLWDLTGKMLVHRRKEDDAQIRWASFLPDGRCWMVTTQPEKAAAKAATPPRIKVQVADVTHQRLVGPPLWHEGDVVQCAISGDGSTLITLTFQQPTRGQKAHDEWVVRAFALKNTVHSIGRPLVSSNMSTQVRVSLDGTRVITYLPSQTGAPLVQDPRGVDQDSLATLWDLRTTRAIALRHSGAVTHADFSPDGRYVITCCADHRARLWHADTGALAVPALEHRARVTHAAFSRCGLVATASHDRTARVWDLTSGEPVTPPLHHDAEVLHVAFAPDGQRLVTCELEARARLWDLSPRPSSDDDLNQISQTLASHRIDPVGGLVAVEPATLRRIWEETRRRLGKSLIPTLPMEMSWHDTRATAAEQAGAWSAALFHLDRLLAQGSPDAQLWARRAEAHAELERWDRAAADFTQAVQRGGSLDLTHALALVHLRAGRAADYLRLCAEASKRVTPTDDAKVRELLVRLCVLAPNDVAIARKVQDLARDLKGDLPWLQGAALYRAGQLHEARKQLLGVVNQDQVVPCLFLAMVDHRVDRSAEARQWLDRAIEKIASLPKASRHAQAISWQTRLTWEVLRGEALALIRASPVSPAVQPPRD